MRVLVVTPYPPKPDGIGDHTEGLVRALAARDEVDVEVLTLRRPAPDEPTPGVHRLLAADPRSGHASLEMMRRTRPDIIHYQFAIPAFGLAGLGAVAAGFRARRALGARLVFTFHEVRRELDLLGGAARTLYRSLVTLADGVIVHTAEARELVVRECRADPLAVWLTPLGATPPRAELIEPAAVEAVRLRYGLTDRPLVLCFGYLHPDKGIEHLVEAIALLRVRSPERGRGLDVLIAGAVRPRSGAFRYFEMQDREYELGLRRAVERHGLADQVRFLGFVPSDDVPGLFTAARVIVVPFTTVTQSSVLSRAAVAGTPAIASDLPGLRDTLGDGGLLVPPADPDALAHALEALAFDDRLAADLRDRQQRHGAAIDLERVAGQLSGIYGRIIGSSGPSRTRQGEPIDAD